MSLFQCDKCGCIENTATSNGGYHADWLLDGGSKEALASYRVILGLAPDAKFGRYCCVCNPIWYLPCTCGTAPHLFGFPCGEYGIGPPPEPKQWHKRFPREFFPLGTKHTDSDGNIS